MVFSKEVLQSVSAKPPEIVIIGEDAETHVDAAHRIKVERLAETTISLGPRIVIKRRQWVGDANGRAASVVKGGTKSHSGKSRVGKVRARVINKYRARA